MPKHYRKIPNAIIEKIQEIRDGYVLVETVLKLTLNDINNQQFSDINFRIENGILHFNSEYIPDQRRGSYSRKNISGYKIKYPDRPKVTKTYYLGERPIFGDYGKGTFSLYVTKQVIDYDEFPPKELSIRTELVEQKVENGENVFIVKISTTEVLDKNSANFLHELFFNLNFLLENIGGADIYPSNATTADYTRSLRVGWEIFPPGERDEDMEIILRGVRGLTRQRVDEIQSRYDFLRNLNPIEIITGISGMRRYFGARFSDRLVVFENVSYGNAIYVLFDNWRQLSQLSRTEIQSRPPDQYIRVKHEGNWQDKLTGIVIAQR